MRKLLLSSLVLLMFSASMLLFQVSCKKEVTAQTSNTSTGLQQLNKILFTKSSSTASDELWLSNYDGTNQVKVNLKFPSNVTGFYDIERAFLSPDGKTIFTLIYRPNSSLETYSFNIDGTGVKKILEDNESLQGAY